MDHNAILSQLQEIFRDVLDNDSIVLTDATTAKDIEEWDSLAHVQLVVAIQNAFGKKFLSKEMMEWQSVNDIIRSIGK